MTDKTIEDLTKKYIVKSSAANSLPKVKGNMQPQINKIKSIENSIRDKFVEKGELNRLEHAVFSLYKLIKNKNG
jgi:hypothetical protein